MLNEVDLAGGIGYPDLLKDLYDTAALLAAAYSAANSGRLLEWHTNSFGCVFVVVKRYPRGLVGRFREKKKNTLACGLARPRRRTASMGEKETHIEANNLQRASENLRNTKCCSRSIWYALSA